MAPRSERPTIQLTALVLPRQLTAYSGASTLGSRTWPHLQGVLLADPDYSAEDPVDLILGADVYGEILLPGLRKGTRHEPVVQNTKLGWILSGAAESGPSPATMRSHQCQVDDDLSAMVRRLWEQEELPPATSALSKAEVECEDHYVRTHFRKPDGRYGVRLPLATSMPDLSGTRRIALRALKRMESRFIKDPAFYSLYREFMQQYMELDHMLPVQTPANGTTVCYLPHHGVLRESSVMTKLRVVFNGSAIVTTGSSLNQHLHCGPNLLPTLADVLLRWRRHRYVLATDVEKMYRQIEVHQQDRDLQRILWRSSPKENIQEYQLKTVTYGLSCAPFLAIRTLHQLAHDEKSSYPLGATALLKDIYMDDVLTGTSTIKEAKELLRQLTGICRAGGFPLKKWSANDAALLSDVPCEDRLLREPRWWQPGESHSTLGLLWHSHEDYFAFSAAFTQPDVLSKRTVLSLTARLFDPLGWLSPVTVRAKIWIQAAWLRGVEWDDPLPEDDAHQWRGWQSELPHLGDIRIPRWLKSEPTDSNPEIHGFADASEKAFAAVVYLLTRDKNNQVQVSLLSAKTKVAPLKQVSLPRLELCAATLLTRLVAHIRLALDALATPTHLWTDSTVVLGWIRGHPASWKTYVANRVSEIQTTLPDVAWHHTPGVDNPADCASRGLSPSELKGHPLWWNGPRWLQGDPEQWPLGPVSTHGVDLPERRLGVHQTTAADDSIDEPELLTQYSELHHLVRITAWCRRWLRLRKTKGIEPGGSSNLPAPVLLPSELDEALAGWIRVVQAINFKKELKFVQRAVPLPKKSPLAKLGPFLDSKGILRVGGRLSNAAMTREAKHPTLLPSASHLTQLLIKATHLRTLHGGVQLTLAALRQEYWVLRGRALVKSFIHRCLPCVRWRAATPQPPMGNLPAPRVIPSRPFLHTGVDYAGPVWLRTSKGRGHRAYKSFLVIFVCLSCRAVHLDVASDYTSDAFLGALRRFISRRGLCKVLYSDRGTNFVGADNELRALFSANSKEGRQIRTRLADERIEWCFNPPAAPHFGGLWEAAVKSVKHHLRRVIGDAKLTYEEMATLLAQIESCLNSRPLQAMSDDPEDLEALTPGHFLVGTALNAIPTSPLTEGPKSLLTRWKLLGQMRDSFWTRWTREYLHSLTHRPKWYKADEEVRIGRLCLLRCEVSPPNKWPLARIESVYPGGDGHTRVVRVRTSTGNLTRPVTKLVLLPVSSGAREDGES
ncbi:uncharacterized protein LOC112639710 [Camponotus floridanus]|uniref:uncharacterized protein LOC112639710 n=1 Tax=Camponotus floridanus TaxID=104421 RepID=UPI000DC6A296|nr:uncharacterized protein LOC112639710 [Camponotus floridanus]